MKKIAALIDFTPTTSVVIEFVKNIAIEQQAVVALVSIVEKGNEEKIRDAKEKMIPFCQELIAANINCTIDIHEGGFFDIVGSVMDKIHATLVVVGTHGKKGFKQNLFGSNILKLVKIITTPCLIVQDEMLWPKNGLSTVLFPIASHSRFEMKINQTKDVVGKAGKFLLYAIYKTDMLDDQLKNNIRLCQETFVAQKVNYELVEEDAQLYSVGFSRQTLAYAEKHKVDMISIMSQVAKDNKFFGNVDKENIILNNLGIPVLCCNDDQIH
jgi:nucleotide-binding universal stress UspA family protein